MTDERIKEIAGEKLTSWAENGKSCENCVFAYGSTPFDDAPDKCSCAIYQYPKIKPDAVFIDGSTCKFFRER